MKVRSSASAPAMATPPPTYSKGLCAAASKVFACANNGVTVSAGVLTLNGSISGSFPLYKDGPGTLIIADNVVRDGKVIDEESTDELVQGVRRFNDALSANPAVTAVVLQLVGVKDHDGMAFALVNG